MNLDKLVNECSGSFYDYTVKFGFDNEDVKEFSKYIDENPDPRIELFYNAKTNRGE